MKKPPRDTTLIIDLQNPQMAYIMGVLKGDGSIFYSRKQSRYGIRLGTMDKPFAERFSEILRGLGVNSKVYGPYFMKTTEKQRLPDGRLIRHINPIYYVQGDSKMIYEWYSARFTGPNSYGEIELYLDTPEKIRLFLKGFYESEGSITTNGAGHWMVRFSNTNPNLLELIRKLLTKAGYRAAPKIYLYRSPNECYHLGLFRNPQSFLDWVQPCIKRHPKNGRLI